RFREDLFFRLSVFTVRLPPLRERPGDVPALADELMGAPTWALLPPDVRERFLTHPWPGNVRELRNALERARHLSGLPGAARAEAALLLPAESAAAPRISTPPAGITHVAPEALAVDYSGGFKEAKERLVSAFEREYLARLLQRTGGNVAAASRIAGVDRK